MYKQLVVLAVVAVGVVVANPMDEINIKRFKDCCPDLAKLLKAESYEKCKKNPCKMQCVLEDNALATTTNNKTTVDLTAVKSAMDKLTAWNSTVIDETKTKCTKSVPEIKVGKCKSGAMQVSLCVMKSLASACPAPAAGKCIGVMKKAPKATKEAMNKNATIPAAAAA